jgi:heme-degrading monooxygenase HmoA
VESISRKGRREGELPFAVCFEVEVAVEGLAEYLTLAGSLRPELECIPGFESIERSRSIRAEGRLLSPSYWADETAVVAWRSHGLHHEAQIIGRNELFADYRLRVGQVIRRWSPESVHLAVRPTAPDMPATT